MSELVAKAKAIIKSNIYMTVATSDETGLPWISPVFFGFDGSYNLYWVSNKDARHSGNIRHRPQAAIVIFDSTAPEGEGDGVYFEAEVKELDDDTDITQGMKAMTERVTQDEFKIKDISEVKGNGAWRIYRASPKNISKLTDGTTINGQYIDHRAEINLT